MFLSSETGVSGNICGRINGVKYRFALQGGTWVSPSNEHPGLIFLRMDWLDLLAIQGTGQRLGITCLEARTEALAMGMRALGESQSRGEEHMRTS